MEPYHYHFTERRDAMKHPYKTREGGATVTIFVPYDCKNHCPFGLDTPALLASQKTWYDKFYEEHRDESEK